MAYRQHAAAIAPAICALSFATSCTASPTPVAEIESAYANAYCDHNHVEAAPTHSRTVAGDELTAEQNFSGDTGALLRESANTRTRVSLKSGPYLLPLHHANCPRG